LTHVQALTERLQRQIDRLIQMNQLATLSATQTPTLIAAAGDRATYRFLEFFTAQIRNPHTRRAYVRAVGAFCAWLEAHGVPSIAAVGSIYIAAYVEDPDVQQHLAAIQCSPGSAGMVGAR
jgi:integrase/recombinase XerD